VAELIREHSTRIKNGDTTYVVRIYAEERSDGMWEGWLEFHPTEKGKRVLRTGQETSQPSRITIEYWAFGLEPIYLEGALARAQGAASLTRQSELETCHPLRRSIEPGLLHSSVAGLTGDGATKSQC